MGDRNYVARRGTSISIQANGSTKKCILFENVFQEFASQHRKNALRKIAFFFKYEVPDFRTVFSTICGTVVEENDQPQGHPWAQFKVEGVETSALIALCFEPLSPPKNNVSLRCLPLPEMSMTTDLPECQEQRR